MKKTRVSHLIDPWIDALEASRDHLVSMLRTKNDSLIDQASRWHFQAARDLDLRVQEVVQSMKYKENPLRPKDLTDLISSFSKLRQQVERDYVQAEKMNRSGNKQARKAMSAAKKSEHALREFARHLRWELIQFGQWGEKMVEALGVDQWL